MDELIERLEKATGANKDLLWDVYAACFGRKDPDLRTHGEAVRHARFYELLNAQAGTEAALTLLPDGWEWALFCDSGEYRVEIGDPKIGLESIATTPALAICIAALKARAALQSTRGET